MLLDLNKALTQDEVERRYGRINERRTSSHDEKKLTAAEIAKALKGKRSGKNWSCCCPAHDDGNASLSIGDGDKGVVVRCHAGCEQDAVIDALRARGLWRGASSAPGDNVHRFRKEQPDSAQQLAEQQSWDAPDTVYDYTTVAGDYAYSVLRKGYVKANGEPDKVFRQGLRHAASGRWAQKHLNGTQRLLYRLPELAQYPDATVFVTEGEKDADRIASLGHCATTVASGNWNVDTSILRGRDCWILEDADVPGVEKARKAADALASVAKTIRIVRLPGQEFTADKHGHDVSDWFDADPSRGIEELTDACLAAPVWNGHSRSEQPEPTAANLVQTSAEFVAGFTPPDYLIDGLMQRRFLYSLTASTGTGKTAIALLLAMHVALGKSLGELEVAEGAVLYFAGENPDDVRMRLFAMTQQFGLVPEDMHNLYFVPGVYKFSEIGDRIREAIANLEIEAAFVVVDTSAAYFEADDENNNVHTGAHARRLRQLVQLEGGPTVLVLCHPVKHAGDDNLLPRGGGAFLAEVDGNLTCKKNDSSVDLYWQGKFRGPDFSPLTFQLQTVTHERLKDTKGKLIPTVISRLLSEEGKQEVEKVTRKDEDDVLVSISQSPELSIAGRAVALGWYHKDGKPYKTRVARAERDLAKAKLIAKARNGWEVTERGKKDVKRLTKKGDDDAE